MSTTTLLVRQNHLADTAVRTTADSALQEGEIRVQVDRFALTSNNITYAAMGDMLQYWQFFPSGEAGWGIIPVWGFGRAKATLGNDPPACFA
eukprot:gene45298-56422_t